MQERTIIPLLIVLTLSATSSLGQMFTDITPSNGLPSGYYPSINFVDIDNDGDQDLVCASTDNGMTLRYNDNLDFTRSTTFTKYDVERQSPTMMDFADFNRDGRVDIVTGQGPNWGPSWLLLNNHSDFTELNISQFTINGTPTFGDYDNDGDVDILSNGSILMNDNHALAPSFYWLSGQNLSMYWADLDRDGRLEILHSTGSYSTYNSYISEKDSTKHHLKGTKVTSIVSSIRGALFADIDSDGDMDMLISAAGWKVLWNNNGVFTAGPSLPGGNTAEIADMNNDGRYDIIIGGVMDTWQVFELQIFANNGNGTFTKVSNTGFVTSNNDRPDFSIADIDRDGDLDLATINPSKLYRNNTATSNARPAAPINLSETINAGYGLFRWSVATDDHSNINGLTYNVDLRRADGTIVTPSHTMPDGTRLTTKMGNAFNNTSYRIGCLQEGSYKWKVQALDASYVGSQFSEERAFTVSNLKPLPPENLKATGITDKQIRLSWDDVANTETAYIIKKRNPFNDIYYDIDTVASNITSYTDTTYLTPLTSYDYRVVAYNCSYTSGYSADVTGQTLPPVFEEAGWLPTIHANTRILPADFDNDNDIDVLLTNDGLSKSTLFRFNGTLFEDSKIVIPVLGLNQSSQWVDFNNDGYIDLLVAISKSGIAKPTLYANDHGTKFIEKPLEITLLQGLSVFKIAPADIDLDGDFDLLLQTNEIQGFERRLRLFENTGNFVFEEKTFEHNGIIANEYAWGDYDVDGDPDILAFTKGECSARKLLIIENNGNGTFTSRSTTFTGVYSDFVENNSEVKWADINSDGYPDIVFGGQLGCNNITPTPPTTLINGKNKTFTVQASDNLKKTDYDIHLEFGDVDLDGRSDLLLSTDYDRVKVYYNSNNGFADSKIDYLIRAEAYGDQQLLDIDNDGDLDLIVAGRTNGATVISYRNNMKNGWGRSNNAPSGPTGVMARQEGSNLELSWSRSTDDNTPQSAITYETFVIIDGDTIVTTHSNINGTRKLPVDGSRGSSTKQTVRLSRTGNVQWGVQAIDASYKSSPFTLHQLTITGPISPITGVEDEPVEVIIFPNPAKDWIYVRGIDQIPRVYNVMGQRMTPAIRHSGIVYEISTAGLEPGIYVISAQSGNTWQGRKIVVE